MFSTDNLALANGQTSLNFTLEGRVLTIQAITIAAEDGKNGLMKITMDDDFDFTIMKQRLQYSSWFFFGDDSSAQSLLVRSSSTNEKRNGTVTVDKKGSTLLYQQSNPVQF